MIRFLSHVFLSCYFPSSEGQDECLCHLRHLSSLPAFQKDPLSFIFFHSVIMVDLYLTNFYSVAPAVPSADWSPTAVLVSHSKSCRWPFLKWELFFFPLRNSQNNHHTAGYFLALPRVVPDKIAPENKYIFTRGHKKATKRAILFAVMNNEAPVITSESEGGMLCPSPYPPAALAHLHICNKSKHARK